MQARRPCTPQPSGTTTTHACMQNAGLICLASTHGHTSQTFPTLSTKPPSARTCRRQSSAAGSPQTRCCPRCRAAYAGSPATTGLQHACAAHARMHACVHAPHWPGSQPRAADSCHAHGFRAACVLALAHGQCCLLALGGLRQVQRAWLVAQPQSHCARYIRRGSGHRRRWPACR